MINKLFGLRAGSDCKKMELDDLCVRWYTKNKSLAINGAGREDLKSQLRAVIYVSGSDAATNQQPFNVDEVMEKDDVPECESTLIVIALRALIYRI